jgi:hypothetical protein
VRLTRAVAPVLVVGAAAFAAGCDGGSGGDSSTETEVPPPVGGQPREADAPPAVENATPEALEACGWTFPMPPAPGSDEAHALEDCLLAIRGYPDPFRAGLDLARAGSR